MNAARRRDVSRNPQAEASPNSSVLRGDGNDAQPPDQSSLYLQVLGGSLAATCEH
jgi:hypothetical protein